jgi:SAM-dependent methyltransferase
MGAMMAENDRMQVFFEIHDDISRGGPGGSESTRKAFVMLTSLSNNPTILDIGCGPGMQTLDLGRLTGGKIIAVDNHQPFLKRLKTTARHHGSAEQITVIKSDMLALCFARQAFDVIWAEGSIYIMGFEKALKAWPPLLKNPGYLAATEISWLEPDPPEELRLFWAEQYPGMEDIKANLRTIRRSGFSAIGHFVLPESDWWNDYYRPIQEKLRALRKKYKGYPEALSVLQMEEREIELYGKYADYYGYVFYVMRRE